MRPDREHDGSPPSTGARIEPLLDADAVAQLLSVKPSWVYEASRSRLIPHVKIGRHIRFLPTDLEAWIRDNRRL
jgi:excisionase family DNA binding protein